MATVIIGIGVSALMVSVGSGTQTNNEGMKLTEAVFLAQELREWTLNLPSVDPNFPNDLMNVTYCPPHDGQGSPITSMSDWSQYITVSWRNESNLAQTVANGSSNIVYVEVCISHQGSDVLTMGWLVARRPSS